MIDRSPAIPRSTLLGLLVAWIALGTQLSCTPGDPGLQRSAGLLSAGDEDSDFAAARAAMVDRQLRARGIDDPRVLDAMSRIPRHEFVPEGIRASAYEDRPLPIGADQTISQPYIVALMTQLVRPSPESHALDVGTGSGYQAAVLAGLVERVHSIEILEGLADSARERLDRLGIDNVTVRHGDGYLGWPEEAPFDLIIVAAAPPDVPPPLIEQLAPGGRLVMPVGEGTEQQLVLIEKRADGSITRTTVASVAFVPMTGAARQSRPPAP